MSTGPKRLLQMPKIMNMQSKKQCSRYKHEIRTSTSDLEPTTSDLRQETQQAGHGKFEELVLKGGDYYLQDVTLGFSSQGGVLHVT